jgi:predicted DNA-binding protein
MNQIEMKNRLEELKHRHGKARSVKAHDAIAKEMDALADEDNTMFSLAMVELAKETNARARALGERERFREATRAVSMAYIAKTYFGRTRGWLYQRINGSIVNGKPAKFNDEERKTLEHAFQDIGGLLTSLRVS